MSTAAEKLRDMLDTPENEPKEPGPTPLKLWQIGEDIERIYLAILDNDGELTPEMEAALDRAQGTFLQKAEAVAFKIEELELSADGAKAAAQRQQRHANTFARAADRLKDYLRGCMERTGQERIRTNRKHIWVQRNGQESVRWTGDTFDAIPERFRRATYALDTGAVREAMKAGETLPPEIEVTRGTHLRVS
jgi:hypothetical protein